MALGKKNCLAEIAHKIVKIDNAFLPRWPLSLEEIHPPSPLCPSVTTVLPFLTSVRLLFVRGVRSVFTCADLQVIWLFAEVIAKPQIFFRKTFCYEVKILWYFWLANGNAGIIAFFFLSVNTFCMTSNPRTSCSVLERHESFVLLLAFQNKQLLWSDCVLSTGTDSGTLRL